jgi:hypothetical protein
LRLRIHWAKRAPHPFPLPPSGAILCDSRSAEGWRAGNQRSRTVGRERMRGTKVTDEADRLALLGLVGLAAMWRRRGR